MIRSGCAPLAARLNSAFMAGGFCCAHRPAAVKGRDPITYRRGGSKESKMRDEPIFTGTFYMPVFLMRPAILAAFGTDSVGKVSAIFQPVSLQNTSTASTSYIP